jgi:hypothetical protein
VNTQPAPRRIRNVTGSAADHEMALEPPLRAWPLRGAGPAKQA